MRRPSKYYAELFVRAAADIPGRELDALTESFMRLLAKENALSRFHEITRLIHAALDRALGKQDLVVTTAQPLTAPAMKSLEHAATEAGFGHVISRVDEEIIGGAILRSGDHRIDQSVKGALGRLYETLTS